MILYQITDSVYDVPNTKIDGNGDPFVPESENESEDTTKIGKKLV